MTSTSFWMLDHDESCSHSLLTVSISVFSILINSWMSYHALLRYIFFSIWHYLVYVKSLEYMYMSKLLNISNLVFYFLDCAIYHIWFESRFKSITFLSQFKEWRFCVIQSKQSSSLIILSWSQFCIISIKEERYWWREYIKDLWNR